MHMISPPMSMFLAQMCIMEYPRALPLEKMKQWVEEDKAGMWDDEFVPAIALRFFDIDEDNNLQAGPRLMMLNERMQQLPFIALLEIPERIKLVSGLASEVANEPIS